MRWIYAPDNPVNPLVIRISNNTISVAPHSPAVFQFLIFLVLFPVFLNVVLPRRSCLPPVQLPSHALRAQD